MNGGPTRPAWTLTNMPSYDWLDYEERLAWHNPLDAYDPTPIRAYSPAWNP